MFKQCLLSNWRTLFSSQIHMKRICQKHHSSQIVYVGSTKLRHYYSTAKDSMTRKIHPWKFVNHCHWFTAAAGDIQSTANSVVLTFSSSACLVFAGKNGLAIHAVTVKVDPAFVHETGVEANPTVTFTCIREGKGKGKKENRSTKVECLRTRERRGPKGERNWGRDRDQRQERMGVGGWAYRGKGKKLGPRQRLKARRRYGYG